jgi:hypothetical protein
MYGYLPSGIIQLHNQIARDLTASAAEDTLLISLKKVSCSCSVDPIGQKPGNKWVSGGPMPMRAICQQCGGNGYRVDEVSVALKAWVYWTYRDWIKINGLDKFQGVDGVIQTRSNIETLPSILACDYITVSTNTQGYGVNRFKLSGQPVLHGMHGDNEVICMWTRMT